MSTHAHKHTDMLILTNPINKQRFPHRSTHLESTCSSTAVTLARIRQVKNHISSVWKTSWPSNSFDWADFMLGCALREGSCGKIYSMYMLGLSHSYYGLTELYVIEKHHLKAVLSGERRNRCRKWHILLLIWEHPDEIGWLMVLWKRAKWSGKTLC